MKPPNSLTLDFSNSIAAEKFQEYFFTQGNGIRLFNYSFLDPNVQALYEIPQKSGYLLLRSFCNKIGDPSRFEKCVVEFVDNQEFQAYAASDGEYHFVAISSSLPILMQTLFQNLVKSTIPFSAEDSEDGEIYLFPDSLESKKHFKYKVKEEIESLLLDTMPENKWEKVLSTKLAEIAVLFCVAHEIAHLVRGHAHLSNAKGFRPLAEIRNSTNEPYKISNRLSQAWEIQADKTAIALVYSYMVNDSRYRKRLIKALKCDKTEDSLIELMGRAMYAISFVLFLVGQEQSEVSSDNTHPSAITRQTYILANIITMLSSPSIGRCEDDTENTVKKAATLAEKAWERTGFQFGDFRERIDDLPDVVKALSRADYLCDKYLKQYQWASFIR